MSKEYSSPTTEGGQILVIQLLSPTMIIRICASSTQGKKNEQLRRLALSRCTNSQLNFQMPLAKVQQHQGVEAARSLKTSKWQIVSRWLLALGFWLNLTGFAWFRSFGSRLHRSLTMTG
jgi:hypothetical protein